jgi:hypothetical protein
MKTNIMKYLKGKFPFMSRNKRRLLARDMETTHWRNISASITVDPTQPRPTFDELIEKKLKANAFI